MIILCLIVTVLAFSYFNILGTKKWHRGGMLLFGALFILSLVLVVANDRNHFGMERKTETSQIPLISSEPGDEEVLTYESVGTKGEKVYLYRTVKNPKKLAQTGQLNVKNEVTYTASTAVLEKKEVVWVYKNHFYKQFFGIVKNNHQLEHETNTFKLTEKWTSKEVKIPAKSKMKEQQKSKK